MFQYAAGRSVAHKLGTELKLDISNFDREGVTRRKYGLGVFNIQENFASSKEITKLTIVPSGCLKYTPRVIKLLERLTGKSHITEGDDIKFDAIPDNSYLEGYWSSEKYFKKIEALLRKEFTFKNKPDRVNRTILSAIKKTNSVSLHVRRGDYFSNPKVNRIFETCGPAYYFVAIRLLRRRVIRPHFFVFSDDPDWVRLNLKLKEATFVDHNLGKNDAEDMRLMSACRHHIIANSTFSWWGAWLDPNPGKVVISPKKWSRDPSANKDVKIPSGWVRI